MKLFAWRTGGALVHAPGLGYGEGVKLTGTSFPFGPSAAQRAYAAGGAGAAGSAAARGAGASRGDLGQRDSVSISTAAASGVDRGGDEAAARRETNLSRLVAGVVQGRVEFDENGVAQVGAGDAIAMYRRPADRNAAATGVTAGRLIDVRG